MRLHNWFWTLFICTFGERHCHPSHWKDDKRPHYRLRDADGSNFLDQPSLVTSFSSLSRSIQIAKYTLLAFKATHIEQYICLNLNLYLYCVWICICIVSRFESVLCVNLYLYLSTCLISFSFAPFWACLVVTFLGWVGKFDYYEEFDFQFTLLGSGGIFHHFCHFQPHFLGPPSILTFGQIRTCQCTFQCAIFQPIQATNTSFITEHNLIWSFSHHSTHQLLLCGPPTIATSAPVKFEIFSQCQKLHFATLVLCLP